MSALTEAWPEGSVKADHGPGSRETALTYTAGSGEGESRDTGGARERGGQI